MALGQRAVRRRGRLADLRARAEAGVQRAVGVQPLDRRAVGLQALGLAHDRLVPVQAERGEVGELLLGDARAHAPGVEVLDAHEEARALRAGEQPRQQRGAQVAEVQRAGGGGRVATGGHRVDRRGGWARSASATRGC